MCGREGNRRRSLVLGAASVLATGCPSAAVSHSQDASADVVGTPEDSSADACKPMGLLSTPIVPGATCCEPAHTIWEAPDTKDLEAWCVGGRWCARYRGDLIVDNSPQCPIEYPTPGTECSAEFLPCVYKCPGTVSANVMICNGGLWCGVPSPSVACTPQLHPDGGADASDAGPD